MILTDKQIRELCADDEKESLIFPFREDSLQSESYDLAIGNKIAVLKKEIQCINILEQDELDGMYDKLQLDDEGYVLSPKEYILVSLEEKVKLPKNITAHLRPRTRFTRMGLIISDQHCNSTYAGRLQVGLFNATNYAIKIFSGIKIAQIVFEDLKEIPSEHKLYKNRKDASYHNENSFIGAKTPDYLTRRTEELASILLGED